jgi:hypothetical protein
MKKELSAADAKKLIETLKNRFEKYVNRHSNIDWTKVQTKLELSENKLKLWSLNQMEITGGEPDVIDFDTKTNEFIFVDCSAESSSGRRSLCFDHEALEARKENKPANSALNMAAEMGITILNETQYRNLLQLGNFDAKTSSWIETPAPIRKLGGALFADFRYNHVFVYHNGAQSYYAARGFRGMLRV